MKQNEADRLAKNLIAKFGLAVKVSLNTYNSEQVALIEPIGVHPNEGFQVRVHIGWRSLFFELVPGKFAGDLLQQMESCSLENKQVFSILVRSILDEKGLIYFRINDIDIDALNPMMWPKNWKFITLSLKKSPLEINTDNHQLTEALINKWTERFFGCIIALAPLEEIDDINDIDGLPEGALKKVFVNRYERSRYNRTLCINFHGCYCNVCKMNFEEKYGELGSGFIHVHHIVPVSKIGQDYIINPIKDLIPLCPNCHAMIHKKDPPLSIDDLIQITKDAS